MSIDKDGLDGLGEALKEILGGALPPGVEIGGVKVVGGRRNGGAHPTMRPATLANLQSLLKGTFQPKFELGDKVKLREHAKDRYRWPKADDVCIVTQVLDAPYRTGESGTAIAAYSKDMAIAFVDGDGDLCEYLHDSRDFEKVGSINDPVTLPDGEVIRQDH